MAWVNSNASAAFANSGTETRVHAITVSGEHATAIGSVILKTGGTSGTAQIGPLYVGAGDTWKISLPLVKADYVTIDNAVAIVEFTMAKKK